MINIDIINGLTNSSSKATFLKLVADFSRYIAEFSQGDLLICAKESALDHYKQAEIACKDFSDCNKIKLSLKLNISVFYNEIMNDPQQACSIVEGALEKAMKVINRIDEDP